jgi:hypothetical protein
MEGELEDRAIRDPGFLIDKGLFGRFVTKVLDEAHEKESTK